MLANSSALLQKSVLTLEAQFFSSNLQTEQKLQQGTEKGKKSHGLQIANRQLTLTPPLPSVICTAGPP